MAKPSPKPKCDAASVGAERKRIIAALVNAGKEFKTADRPLLDLYLEMFRVFKSSAAKVRRNGLTTTHVNGATGQTADFKALMEVTEQLRKLLNDLGLTPVRRSTRKWVHSEDQEKADAAPTPHTLPGSPFDWHE